jgi:hypothetical protein
VGYSRRKWYFNPNRTFDRLFNPCINPNNRFGFEEKPEQRGEDALFSKSIATEEINIFIRSFFLIKKKVVFLHVQTHGQKHGDGHANIF